MLKVLIVEDEEILRKGLVYTFDWLSRGYVVIGEAADGKEGLEKILACSPDLVVADIRMPVLGGLEMIENACFHRRFHSILLTGYSEFEYARKALSLNVFEYLLKPLDEEELAATLLRLRVVLESARKDQLDGDGISWAEPTLSLIPDGKTNHYVQATLQLIEKHYWEKLNVRDLAQRLQISESYLSRKFREETGNTFQEFLYKYRIQKAIELLSQGDRRIGEISEQVGFSEYKNFSSVFRKFTGMSTSEFLRKRRGTTD